MYIYFFRNVDYTLQCVYFIFVFLSDIPVKILQGHDGRVTCLLYPFNESTRYEPQHLLSGGADFSVILWDINSGCKVHTFTVHGGELTHMLVPPGNCNVSITVRCKSSQLGLMCTFRATFKSLACLGISWVVCLGQ